MSKTIGQAFLELAVGGIPVPPPRVKMTFDKIKIDKIMEEKRKHPATVAEMALRGIKEDMPLSEMMEIVKDALILYGYKDAPKEEPQPSSEDFYKDGDFCVCSKGVKEMRVFINKGPLSKWATSYGRNIKSYAHLERNNILAIPYTVEVKCSGYFIPGDSEVRLATPEEKRLLLDEMAKVGYRWDEDIKIVVKNYWKPEMGETYYIPYCCRGVLATPYTYRSSVWAGNQFDLESYENGYVFQTKEECDTFCQKLNEAIQNVKRE